MSDYTVSRDEQQLGSFDLSQIEEGLKTGYFKPDDWGWRQGMPEWITLTEIAASATKSPKVVTLKPEAVKPVVVAAGVNPYAAPKAGPAQASAVSGSVPYPVMQELRGTQPWVRLISVLMWIVSIINLLGLAFYLVIGLIGAGGMADSGKVGIGVGFALFIVVAVGISAMLVIYPTLKLSKYASSISRLSLSQSFTDLTLALAEQRRFWKFCGILCTIYLVFLIVGIVLVMFFGIAFMPKVR